VRGRLARLLAPVLALALVGVAGGCGVPNDSTPRIIAASEREQLEATTTTTPAVQELAPTEAVIKVYLLDSKAGTLVPVDRMAGTSAPARVQALLDLELTPAEKDQGLVSLMPPDTKLLAGTHIEGVDLVVDLSKEFNVVTGEAQNKAVAQIVYTATEGRNVSNVAISVEGKRYDVPGEDGVAKPSLKRSDFRSFDPSASSSTTAPSTTPPTSNTSPGRR
jgi:spore germination protein GerM